MKTIKELCKYLEDDNGFIEKTDMLTTILRFIATVISLFVTIGAYLTMNRIFDTSSDLLDNMPDGSGVVDGYIVIGKVFGSIGAGFAGIVLAALILLGCFITVIGIILCVVYLVQRSKYKKSADSRFLFRNICVKSIANGISIVLLISLMFDLELFTPVCILILLLLLGIEALLLVSWRKLRGE